MTSELSKLTELCQNSPQQERRRNFTDKFGLTIFEFVILKLRFWYIAIQNRL